MTSESKHKQKYIFSYANEIFSADLCNYIKKEIELFLVINIETHKITNHRMTYTGL